MYPIQTNFSSGILSPKLQMRTGIQEYREGLADTDNMIVSKQGSIYSRNGTKFITNKQGVYTRNFGFKLIPNNKAAEAYTVLVANDGTLSVVGAEGLVGSIVDNSNPDFNSLIAGWNPILVAGKGTVTGAVGRALLTPEKLKNGESVGVSQEIDLSPDMLATRTISYSITIPQSTVRPTTTLLIGSTEGAGDLGTYVTNTFSQSIEYTPTTHTNIWITVKVQNTRDEITEQEPGVVIPDTLYGVTSLNNFTVIRGIEGAIDLTHNWTLSDIATLNVEQSPEGFDLYFITQRTYPYKLSYDLISNTWVFGIVNFISAPASWVEDNYPTCLTFFAGRSWWGGVQSKPRTFWGSKPTDVSTIENELEDLTIGATDSDGLEFTLSRSGRIMWMEGSVNLVIGSTDGEFIVNGSAGFITPSDISVTQQSEEGGSGVNSIKVGSDILFVSGDGRKVLGTRYFRDQFQWRATDFTFIAEHLTQDKRIVQLIYTRNPTGIVWCLMDDGTLIAFTYNSEPAVRCWHKHNTGFIVGISELEKAGTSSLVLMVKRLIDGVEVYYHEEIGNEYMDSSFTFDMTSTTITVPHLPNTTVQVLIDGSAVPDVTLDVNGSAVLEYQGLVCSVGLKYTSSFRTLEPSIPTKQGSSFGNEKRWSNIGLNLLDSTLPSINGKSGYKRFSGTLMGYPDKRVTGNFESTSLGFGNGSILVEQPLPFRIEVIGIFGKLKQNKL